MTTTRTARTSRTVLTLGSTLGAAVALTLPAGAASAQANTAPAPAAAKDCPRGTMYLVNNLGEGKCIRLPRW
ncbi:hypothetical protein ACIBF1_21635 [Spirillospora sp. NPDC050679]